MDFQEKNDEFQKLIRHLIEIAERDQKITKNEAKLLKSVKLSVDEFQGEVKQALDDGIITEFERLKLKTIEDKFLQDVFDIIEDDENLDEDIETMIEILFNVLMNTL